MKSVLLTMSMCLLCFNASAELYDLPPRIDCVTKALVTSEPFDGIKSNPGPFENTTRMLLKAHLTTNLYEAGVADEGSGVWAVTEIWKVVGKTERGGYSLEQVSGVGADSENKMWLVVMPSPTWLKNRPSETKAYATSLSFNNEGWALMSHLNCTAFWK